MKRIQPKDPDMLPEYDFTDAPRGKYGPHYAASNAVLLEPDVAKLFPDSEAVNKALRALGQIITEQARRKPRSRSKRPVAAE